MYLCASHLLCTTCSMHFIHNAEPSYKHAKLSITFKYSRCKKSPVDGWLERSWLLLRTARTWYISNGYGYPGFFTGRRMFRNDRDSNPGSHGCDLSALPLSYPGTNWIYKGWYWVPNLPASDCERNYSGTILSPQTFPRNSKSQIKSFYFPGKL